MSSTRAKLLYDYMLSKYSRAGIFDNKTMDDCRGGIYTILVSSCNWFSDGDIYRQFELTDDMACVVESVVVHGEHPIGGISSLRDRRAVWYKVNKVTENIAYSQIPLLPKEVLHKFTNDVTKITERVELSKNTYENRVYCVVGDGFAICERTEYSTIWHDENDPHGYSSSYYRKSIEVYRLLED